MLKPVFNRLLLQPLTPTSSCLLNRLGACLGYLLWLSDHLFIVWLGSNLAISVFLHLLSAHCSPSSTRLSTAHLALQNYSSGSILQLIYLSTLLEPSGKSTP